MASLTRQLSLSQDVVFNQRNQHALMAYLMTCPILQYGSVRRAPNGHIYWNSEDRLHHLSFHSGGTATNSGAIHYKYTIPALGREYNFRIYILFTRFGVEGGRSFGRHIVIDDRELNDIGAVIESMPPSQDRELLELEWNNIYNMIDEIGNCLKHFFDSDSNRINNYIRGMLGGFRKKTKGKKTKGKKTKGKKTKKNKTLSHRRKGGAVLGKFYVLNEDEHGFRPLYLTLENVDSSSILAWSCPPEKYPNPHYFIRGMQQDILPISILKEEIDITKMTKRGGNIILTDGYYKIKLSKDWINDHSDLWETIVSNYNL